MDVQQQNVIYRKYGDHLYQKGDYDNAMSQYIKAIDNTEPSQVIRKVSRAAHRKHFAANQADSSSIASGYTISSSTWKNYTSITRRLPTTRRYS